MEFATKYVYLKRKGVFELDCFCCLLGTSEIDDENPGLFFVQVRK